MLIASEKLFLESYFDNVLCALMNLLALLESPSFQDLREFFIGRDNIIN